MLVEENNATREYKHIRYAAAKDFRLQLLK